MPIYAYRCASCGHAQDVLQKLADAPLSVCPSCGAEAFRKQVTAAGFQLKGSGWYATDFKGNGAAKAKPADTTPDGGDKGSAGGDKGSSVGDGASAAPESKPAATAATPAAAPATAGSSGA